VVFRTLAGVGALSAPFRCVVCSWTRNRVFFSEEKTVSSLRLSASLEKYCHPIRTTSPCRYKDNYDAKKYPYDSPKWRLSHDGVYYVVFNESTGKILKSVKYSPCNVGLLGVAILKVLVFRCADHRILIVRLLDAASRSRTWCRAGRRRGQL